MQSLKSLKTEDGRREYYSYDLSNPESMVHHAEPYLDPRFNEELKELFGCDSHGDPRFRIVWCGNLRAPAFKDTGTDIIEYEGMKYPYMRLSVIDGYFYFNKDNKRVKVQRREQEPIDAMFVEDMKYDDLGIMRFAVEMKFTREELVAMKRYPEPGSPEEATWCVRDGKRYRPEPNPTGEYMFVHYIETPDGEYKDVTDEVIENIRFMFNRALTETDEEYVARKLEARRKLALAQKLKEDQDQLDFISDSRIRAEKKLARGQIIYSR